jgi:hypothetical protein
MSWRLAWIQSVHLVFQSFFKTTFLTNLKNEKYTYSTTLLLKLKQTYLLRRKIIETLHQDIEKGTTSMGILVPFHAGNVHRWWPLTFKTRTEQHTVLQSPLSWNWLYITCFLFWIFYRRLYAEDSSNFLILLLLLSHVSFLYFIDYEHGDITQYVSNFVL